MFRAVGIIQRIEIGRWLTARLLGNARSEALTRSGGLPVRTRRRNRAGEGMARIVAPWLGAVLGVATASAQSALPTTPPGLPPLPDSRTVVLPPPAGLPGPMEAPGAGPGPVPPALPQALPGPLDGFVEPPQEEGRIEIGNLVEVVGEPTEEVPVIVGRSRIFALKKPAARIMVANPAIANLRFLDPDAPSPRLLDVYGLSFGQTILTIWDEQEQATSIRLRVTIDTKDLEKRLSRVFPGADVRVTQVGTQVVLEGQVPDAKTMSEVLQVVQSTLLGEASSVPVMGGGGGGGNPGVALLRPRQRDEDIQKAAYQFAPGPPGGMPVPGAGAVEPGVEPQQAAPGESSLPADDEAALPAAMPYASAASPKQGGGLLPPGTIVNRVHVPGPRQVLLKVKIAELDRSALRQIGVNWQVLTHRNQFSSLLAGVAQLQKADSQTGNLLQSLQPGSTPGSQLFGVFNSDTFSLYINALRQNNLVKVLAEPNLIALDGQPAEFLAGGKFPYPVPQVRGAGTVVTIQFEQFGAILQFIPHILEGDTIRLDVNPVFSQLDYATGTSSGGTVVPGIDQRSARTVVQLREGQTLALAGLLQFTTNNTTTRIPGLGDVPILGTLFRQNEATTRESELVVLVTPYLIDPMEPEEVPLAPGDNVFEPNDFEFFFLGRIEGRTGHPFRSTLIELDPLNVMKHFRNEDHWVVGPHGYSDD